MNIETKQISFISHGFRLSGVLTYPLPKNSYFGVLFLHGGGKYTDSRYTKWQKFLAENGYSSMSFFCQGVSTSQGQFEDSTLKQRLLDSEEALNFFLNSGVVDQAGIAVVGTSMGGHIANQLSTHKKVQALILESAAAYPEEAEDKKLNNSFTQIIRSTYDFSKLPVFDLLSQFNYPVLTVYGQNDTIIPEQVKVEYRKRAKKTESVVLKNGGHSLLLPKNNLEEKARQELFTVSLSFLNRCFS